MQVVSPRQRAADRARSRNAILPLRWLLVVLSSAAIAFIAAWVIKGELAEYGGVRNAWQQWQSSHGAYVLNNSMTASDWLKAPYHALWPVEVPQLVLDIKFKDFQKIEAKRQQALKRGLLVTEKGDYVPAKIRHDGVTSKVKLRLKGDLLDHLKGDKWSFRVKVKGKHHLYGMRVFSVQDPQVRGFQGAPLYYETLRRYGVIAPRYKLVNLVVNGHDVGIMSVEEHFAKEMLEASGRKESVIIRFDESLVWEARDGAVNTGLGGHFDNYHLADIDAFSTKKINKSPSLKADYDKAVSLLRAFETGSKQPSEVFDVRLMGAYIAVAELWGSWHSFSWRNMRFYYNPITARLEPIGNDPDVQNRSKPGKNRAGGEPITSVMRTALLDDPEIFDAFHQAIQTIAEDMQSGKLLEQLRQLEAELLPVLRKEFFLLQAFDEKELKQRLGLLENISREQLADIYDIHYQYPEVLQAWLVDVNGKSALELANISPSVVELVSMRWYSDSGAIPPQAVVLERDRTLPFELPPAPRLGAPQRLTLPLAGIPDNSHIELLVRIQGSQQTSRVIVQHGVAPLQHNLLPESSLQQQLAAHADYLYFNEQENILVFRPGRWLLKQPLITPVGVGVTIPAGTTLYFAETAFILSRGTVRMNGNADNPVQLSGAGDQGWPGMVVLEAARRSYLEYVEISGTNGRFTDNWQLTGGVTFYRSDVTIENSLLKDSRGEDALNIVHANFDLQNLNIRTTASDAFDSDFSTGTVKGGRYENIGLAGGGDAIDVSGTNIRVDGAHFMHVDDKAISVGEASQMQAENLVIEDAGTGAASKDGSRLILKASRIINARVAGLLAYIKKPEYGAGRIEAENITFGNAFEPARAQKGSVILIDGEVVETVDVNVKQMYRTVMKKGLKR